MRSINTIGNKVSTLLAQARLQTHEEHDDVLILLYEWQDSECGLHGVKVKSGDPDNYTTVVYLPFKEDTHEEGDVVDMSTQNERILKSTPGIFDGLVLNLSGK